MSQIAELSVESVTFLGVCALGGVLFLKVAILGGSFWPPVEGLLPSRTARILCTLAGLTLLGVGIALSARSGFKIVPGPVPKDPRVDRVVSDVEKLQGHVAVLESNPSVAPSVIAIDTDIRALRAGVMTGNPSGDACDGSSTPSPKSWVKEPQTPCARLKNAQWTVYLQGDIDGKAKTLPDEIRKLGIGIVVGPPPVTEHPAPLSSLGMVYDEDAPAELICAIAHAYETATGLVLEAVTTQRIFVRVAKINTSSFGIRLGVPFDEFFASYHKITPPDWTELCKSSQQAQFETWFAKQGESITAAAAAREAVSGIPAHR